MEQFYLVKTGRKAVLQNVLTTNRDFTLWNSSVEVCSIVIISDWESVDKDDLVFDDDQMFKLSFSMVD